jgi:hypothetical protein
MMSEIAAEVIGGSPAGDSQPDPVSAFSFGGDLHKQAMEFQPEADTQEPAQPVVEQVVAPQGDVPAEPKNVDTASASQLAKLKDTDLVEVTVDGQPVQMPWGQAKGGVMRQAHYTKEMQSLRAEQSAFQSEQQQIASLRKEHEAFVTLLRDPNLLREFVGQKYPSLMAQQQAVAAAAAQVDPDDIVTVGQIQATQAQLEQRIADVADAMEQTFAEREANIARNIETKHATLKLANEVNSTIKSLFDEHPHMAKLIPDAEQVLRYNVSKMKPKTEQEAIEAFKTVFGGWVEKYNDAVTETTKTKTIAKQKMLATNIQPPGGAGVQPQPTNFKKVDKITGKESLDWDKLHEAALAAL